MAKKKSSSPPPPQPISVGEVMGQINASVPNLARTTSNANIYGAQLGMAATADYLASDGRSLTTNPKISQDANKILSAERPKLTRAETLLKTQQGTLAQLQARLNAATPGTAAHNSIQNQINALNTQILKTETAISGFQTKIEEAEANLVSGPSVTELYQTADPNTYAALDRARGFADRIGTTTAEGQRFLDATSAGYQARDIGQNNITAANLGEISDIRAQQIAAAQARAEQTGTSGLGNQLMQTAGQRLALGGRLSEQDGRDATQAARAGMAARGMATGNNALALELLNRDRFTRQRFMEDAGFAQGVENSDLERRMSNTRESNLISAANMAEANRITIANQQADLEAQIANQSTALSREQSNVSEANRIGIANQNNAYLTNVFNEQNRLTGEQQNINQLAAASNFIDNQNQQGYNTALNQAATEANYNPLFRNLGMTSQNILGTNNTGSQALGVAANVVPAVHSFNANMVASNWNTAQTNNAALEAARITGGATQNAGWMALLGSGMQAGGQLGSAYLSNAQFSDRRMKKDIKPIGKAPLGLTTYEYRYKDGDNRKRVGFMAQDVRKVLPEAVQEVQYKGQTRLAIKPRVIGQAISEALADSQKALFKGGYKVGSGMK